jgi:LPXTG-site transpeptidase (sortase) family protein
VVKAGGTNRLSIALIAVGTIMMLSAIALFAGIAPSILEDRNGNSDLETVAGFGEPIKTPTPGPPPTPIPAWPPPSEKPLARLVIPAAEIDAPVVIKGVDATGVMQSPDNAYDTAWYDFSAKPGWGGNAVFSGHVDYIRVGKAVFWNIKDLNPGDVIEVRLNDGTVYKYAVTYKEAFDAATAPVDQIVGPTSVETVTLITCNGTFNSATHQYDKRLVVRAERIIEQPPSGVAP